jgi:hypothetical protein
MSWTKSGKLTRFGCTILLGTLALKSLPAVAEQHTQCPPVPSLEVGAISVETKTGMDAVAKLLAKFGIEINVRTERDNVLKANPRADQVVIVLTMANIYCRMLWSDTSLNGEEKASRFKNMMQDLLTPAAGPMPVARTTATGWNENRIILASNELFELADEPELALPKPQVGFLRDAPFLINDYNKYFVIVGSASTREDGLRLMKSLKSKAPQYDFALYEPYGDNPNFGIMMASWVPRDVALEALDIARRTVARDAVLWACRSKGDSC